MRLRAQIAALRRDRGTTIVLTTHYMREAEELCDEIAFIKGGRILALGTSDDLKRKIRVGDVIALRVDAAGAAPLADHPGVLRSVTEDGWVELTVDSAEKRLGELLQRLHESGAVVRDVQIREPQLEDVFVELAR